MQTVTKDYLALVTTFETTQTDDVRLEVVKEIADDLEVKTVIWRPVCRVGDRSKVFAIHCQPIYGRSG